jgi:tagatose-6-phosphate ketose/aldose isomerase
VHIVNKLSVKESAHHVNPLIDLLGLSAEVKQARGLEHTPGEIARQPGAWAETFLRFQKVSAELGEFLRSAGIGGVVEQRPTVFLIGAGSSDYIGRSLVHLLRRQWQCDVVAVPNTDLLTDFYHLLLPERRYLWISFSRSGESPEAVAVVEKALCENPQIKHVVISCNPQGRLLGIAADRPQAFSMALDEAANDRGLAMTCSFSSMLVCGQCMAHTFNLNEYASVLQQLIGSGEALLAAGPNLAAELSAHSYRKACFIGGGPLRGIASECALKVLELTAGKTHGMSESPLGLRHGPMAALDEETLLVCFLSSDDRRRSYETDLLREIDSKHLVRARVAVNCDSTLLSADVATHTLSPISRFSIPDYYRGPVDVIAGQLLGLFFSIHWNLKPDSPSFNNAISRVVPKIRIYD